MPQIQGIQTGPSVGGALGSTTGKAIGEGLSALAHHKLQELGQRQQEVYAQKVGISPDVTRWVNSLDPKSKEQAYQNISGLVELSQHLEKQNQMSQQQPNPMQTQPDQQMPFQPQGQQPGNVLEQLLSYNTQKQAMGQQQPQGQQLGGLNALMGAQQGQVPQAAQPSQPAQEQFDYSKLFQSSADRRSKETLGLKEGAQQFREQQSIKPFLHAEVEDYKAKKNAGDIAKSMLENIKTNKDRWPGPLVGNLPVSAQNLIVRDKNVRKFIADANSLVTALAGTRKGVPTNFKLKLEALSKADLSQPIETQEELLKDVIKKSKQAADRQKYISGLKKDGKYPLDIEQKVVEYDLRNEDLEQFEIGQELDSLPNVGSMEFDNLPQGFSAEQNGILHTKVGDQWNKRKVKA